MAINYVVSKTGVVETQDFNVKMQKTIPAPASAERFNKIAVIASQPGKLPEEVSGKIVVPGEDTKKIIKEQSEVQNFVGPIYVWNQTADNLKAKLAEIKGLVKTVILLSGTSTQKFMELDWGDLAVFATETNNPTQLDDWCGTTLRGAFLDEKKEGVALNIVSKMLEIPRAVLNPMRIDGSAFSGIVSPEVVDLLDDAGFSFFVRGKNGSFAKSVWMGKNQAFAIFNDFIVEYDVKETINQYILQGAYIDNESLAEVETRIISQLQQNVSQKNIREIKRIIFPSVEDLTATQRKNGQISKVIVEYYLLNVVRSVVIDLTGEN